MSPLRRIPGRLVLRPEALLILIIVLTCLRPQDMQWVNDEPAMMDAAIQYNHTPCRICGIRLPFTLAPSGLPGSRQVQYGPLPTWLDQLFLLFGNNLIAMLQWRTLIFASITAAAVYSLTQTLRLSPWYAVVTMLSPWLWLYARFLWDNTWCIPLSAGLLATYASFLQIQRRWTFQLTIVLILLLPMIHLIALPLVAAVALHLLFFRRQHLWRWKWHLAVILIIWACLFQPYLRLLFAQGHHAETAGLSDARGWLFAMLGGSFLTFGVPLTGSVPNLGWPLASSEDVWKIFLAARYASWIALLFVWLGMILAFPRARLAQSQPATATTRNHLCVIALCTWILQCLLDGNQAIFISMHYQSGTWIVYAFFAWIAVDWLLSRFDHKYFIGSLAAIYSACLTLGIAMTWITIARNAGTRNVWYGTTVGNQIEAVRAIEKFSDQSTVDIEFNNWRRYPIAPKVLKELYPPPPGPKPVANLVVDYANSYPSDARIAVRQAAAR